MQIFLERTRKILKKIFIIILILLCLLSLVLFISIIKEYSRSGELGIEYKINGKPTQRYRPIRINSIKSWMTFDYINVIFKLNPDYLKNVFNIDDPKYPNIRIDIYVKKHNLSSQEFLDKVEQSINNYSYNK